MYARVTQYKIHPGKLDQFTATVDSLMPAIQQLPGFRFVIVLRGTAREKPDAMVVSVWDSLETLHACDNNVFLNQALARLMSCCEAFPTIREQEVLLSEFATT